MINEATSNAIHNVKKKYKTMQERRRVALEAEQKEIDELEEVNAKIAETEAETAKLQEYIAEIEDELDETESRLANLSMQKTEAEKECESVRQMREILQQRHDLQLPKIQKQQDIFDECVRKNEDVVAALNEKEDDTMSKEDELTEIEKKFEDDNYHVKVLESESNNIIHQEKSMETAVNKNQLNILTQQDKEKDLIQKKYDCECEINDLLDEERDQCETFDSLEMQLQDLKDLHAEKARLRDELVNEIGEM